ncbi:MAG: PIG-L family deacetylase [Planctomycetes bacterium]|nr:PIG-L family deacetylase [Planctomycetota bacterium]
MNILVIGPHPDDQEIGMGGTIVALAEQGHNVLICDMTDGCPTPVGDRPTRLAEAEAALACLQPTRPGTTPLRRVLMDFPNRRVEHTLEARHRVAGLIRAHQAQVVFLPHEEDAHPDHREVTRIVEDARFDAKLTKIEMPVPPGFASIGPPIYPKWLIYYYCSHLRRVPDPTFIMDTSATSGKKIAAVGAYRTQFELNPKNAGFPERLAHWDSYFGSRIGAAAGEPFFTKEPLGLNGFAGLVM